MAAYQAFLAQIGYIVPAPAEVHATTSNVDDELAVQAGPQLVVPVLNARYALNAANARWGSLYDALYGTDAIIGRRRRREGPLATTGARRQGDCIRPSVPRPSAPLAGASHQDAAGYAIVDGQLAVTGQWRQRRAGNRPSWWATRRRRRPSSVLLVNNGLHIDIRIDRKSTTIGARTPPAWLTWCWKPRCPPF